ncbi:MAG: hypothetical protein GX483_08545 [Actinomycetaceae bacterium]|nr:hypothetical protein [Actinomycetaceae bacterium]
MRSRIAVKNMVRDPRLLFGMILIIGGGILGALILGGQEEVAVLRAGSDIAQGEPIAQADVESVYIPVGLAQDLMKPEDLANNDAVALRSLGSGELIRRDALGVLDSGVVITIGVVTAPASELTTGSHIDIWRIESATIQGEASARVIAQDAILVREIEQSGYSDGLHYVEVRVDGDDVGSVLEVLGANDSFAIVKASE